MHCHGAAHQLVHVRALRRVQRLACLNLVRPLLLIILCIAFVLPARGQGSGNLANEFQGRGAEITVTVHDTSGQPISSAAIVRLYRDGATLTRQGQTSRGSAELVVNSLGEFTVTVEAAGYQT